MKPVYIVSALRTPIGKHRGTLSTVRPDDLAALLIHTMNARNPEAVANVDHVVFGATNQAGEDNRNVARMASLLADLPFEVPAVTVNRLCGSGLEAVVNGAMRIACDDAELVIAGGVESMTRAPLVMGKGEEAFSRTPPTVFDTSLGWRFTNPRMKDRFEILSMGETAENVAEKWKVTREEQDAFAVSSHAKAAKARKDGAFANEIVPVPLPVKKGAPESFLRDDESIREDASLEALTKLKPVFRANGSVTAGNSSPLNDGASAVLLASEGAVRAHGLVPLAKIVSFATVGLHPNYMGEGPIPAGKKALERANWKASDLDLVELNEAFAAQAIACIRGLELEPAKVNVRGGAIALGHPIGSSGARILATLVHTMKDLGKVRGMAALCIGVGQGIAVTVERS